MAKGLSTIVATLLLVAITVAVVPLLYLTVRGYFGRTGGADVSPEELSVVVSSGICILTASIKNTGTVALESCTVTFYLDNQTSFTLQLPAPIQPGASSSADNICSLPFQAGRNYPVVVRATASDGSVVTRAYTVLAR